MIDDSGMLTGYRVLDLCGPEGLICGKLLADLGAEVIKVEPPGGDAARTIGPFFGDDPDPAGSLSWLAYNTGKRGITLDLERPEGRDLFLELIARSDAVVESFSPGHLDRLGLGYDRLAADHPGLVLTSIRPVGDFGPYRDWLGSDLVLWALSGLLFICGDPDRPPVRISLPQAWQHAGVDAATGTVMALFHRGRTGPGQRVQVSALKAMERVAYTAHILWDARGKVLRRPGSGLKIPPRGTSTPVIWACRDGFVAFYLFGGAMGAVSNPALTGWMAEEGLASPAMLNLDWPRFDIGRTPQEDIDRDIVSPIAEFFRGHTQAELWEEGVRRRVMVYPVNDAQGVLGGEHLQERGFWVKMEHPELDATLTYPGPFIKTPGDLCQVRGPAPGIGQHNEQVYGELLGLSPEDINGLLRQGVI
jgi:crotonobetainyl-CoA:carnitine CoA-transferase CaiB-like acyl-CoA transferase